MAKLEMTSKMLDETQKSTSSSLNRVNILNEKIEIRQVLISQIGEEISLIDQEISSLKNKIKEQEDELESLKKEYAQLMYHAYIRRNSYDKLMFILSAKTFSQSYRRFRYLQEFSDYRQQQAKRIEELTMSLNDKLKEIERHRIEKETVLRVRETENTKLQEEKTKQESLVSELKDKEKDLLKEIKKHQKQIDAFNDKIEKLIAEEERKARERAEKARLAKEKAAKAAAGQKSGKEPLVTPMTKEEKLIAGNFEKNKGRLPWPVERGIIVGKFGIHPHPVLSHVTTNNKGIYIQTEKGENARAVFEGEVTQLFSIPGNNNAIIVRHGNYRTVYSNLTDIYVKEGDKVNAKQKLGKIYSDPEDGKTSLYFMVWKEKELQNPELFLAK